MRETKPFVAFLQRIMEIIPDLTVWGGVWTEGKNVPNPPRVQVAVLCILCSGVERNWRFFFTVKYLTRRKLQSTVFLLNIRDYEYKLV